MKPSLWKAILFVLGMAGFAASAWGAEDVLLLPDETYTTRAGNESSFYPEDPACAVDGAGNVHIVFNSAYYDTPGPSPPAYRHVFYMKTDADGRILVTPLQLDDEDDGVDSQVYAHVAVDGNGYAHVVWQGNTVPGNRPPHFLYYSKIDQDGRQVVGPIRFFRNNEGWGIEEPFPELGNMGWGSKPRVAVGLSGMVHVVLWGGYRVPAGPTVHDMFEVFYIQLDPGSGEVVRGPMRLTESTPDNNGEPEIATGSWGGVYAAWRRGSEVYVARLSEEGDLLDGPAPVVDDLLEAQAYKRPGLAVDKDGNAHLLFTDKPTGMWQTDRYRSVKVDAGGNVLIPARILREGSDDRDGPNPGVLATGPNRIDLFFHVGVNNSGSGRLYWATMDLNGNLSREFSPAYDDENPDWNYEAAYATGGGAIYVVRTGRSPDHEERGTSLYMRQLVGREEDGAGAEELTYDDGEPSAGYYYEHEGVGSAVRMSPPFSPAAVYRVSYFLTSADGSFVVRLFADRDGEPGAELMEPLTVRPVKTGWFEVDLTGYDITVDGDFYAGFMCGAEATPGFGYDEVDNGRGWDFDGVSWASWSETYLFRAVVAPVGAVGPVGDNALSLDGEDDYVECGDEGSLGIADEMTVEAWIKVSSSFPAGSRVGIILGNYPHSPNFNLEGHTNGRLRLWWNDGQQDESAADFDMRDDTWHHVAVTRDRGSDKIIFYVDGHLRGEHSAGSNADYQWPLRIGGDFRSDPGMPFSGLVDEIRLWNRTLNQEELQANIFSALTGSEDGLVAYYDFDEPAGSTVIHDRTGNGNHGTLHGDPELVPTTRPVEPSADVTPPAILSGPSAAEITETSAVVTWATDEAGSTVVEYGTTAEYGLSATGMEGTEHRVALAGLEAGTTYHYRAGSTDASGNAAWSEDQIFETERGISLLVEAIQGNRRVDSPLRTLVGRTIRFEVAAFSAPDSSDLQPVADYAWEVPETLGTPVGLGKLELTTVAGVSETILFRVGAATAEFQVIITPHSIRTVEIEPAELVIEPGGRQTFRATARDRYGNLVLGKNFGWHVVGDIGTINSRTGDFVAGGAPGEGYVIAVVNNVLVFADAGTSVEGVGKVVVRRSLPERFCLYPNAPNPFNPSTEIGFDLPEESRVRLAIFNLAGQEVERLIDGVLPAGTHRVRWEAKGQPSGIYLYRLEAGGQQVETRKMALVR